MGKQIAVINIHPLLYIQENTCQILFALLNKHCIAFFSLGIIFVSFLSNLLKIGVLVTKLQNREGDSQCKYA